MARHVWSEPVGDSDKSVCEACGLQRRFYRNSGRYRYHMPNGRSLTPWKNPGQCREIEDEKPFASEEVSR